MSKYALVSTVDTMGKDFPCHCVMLFDSEVEAIANAVGIILEHDENATRNPENGNLQIGGSEFTTIESFLDAWQEGLDMTEFFHVMPVESRASAE